MKVLQINSVCGIRSTGRICTDIAQVLKEQGDECIVAFGREIVPDKYSDFSYRILSNSSAKIDAIKTRVFDNAGFNSDFITKRFIRWIKEYKPDVIHLHNIHGYYINVEFLFKFLKGYGKPVIWTLHDCWPFTGHCTHFSINGCSKWKDGCFSCPQKGRYPKSLFFDNSKNNYKRKKELFSGVNNMTIVTPSKWLAELVKQSFLCDYDVKVINNGIDTDVFKPTFGNFKEKNDITDKKIVLGVASQWDKGKGLDDFVKLSEMLDSSYKIVLVGLTREQIETLPDNILGITRTNNANELAEIYTVADVFVNPTYEDNYPTVNLEAQACGTAVITYRTGGSVESVPDCNVVEQGDLQGLCNKIYNLAKKPLLYEGDFSSRLAFEKYIKLYKEKTEIL